MNKTIKDGPQITRYCDWDYFWKHLHLMEDYHLQSIRKENALLEINFGDYDIQVDWIRKDELERIREKQEREKYSFNCFNKKYDRKKDYN